MKSKKKLDEDDKHFLRLIAKEQQCPDGWCPVSQVMYLLVKKMPSELVEHQEAGEGKGRARLTDKGAAVLEAMSWL